MANGTPWQFGMFEFDGGNRVPEHARGGSDGRPGNGDLSDIRGFQIRKISLASASSNGDASKQSLRKIG